MVSMKNTLLSEYSFSFIICLLLLCGTGQLQGQVLPTTNTETQAEEPEAPQFPPDSLGRRTPRGTVSGFIKAVADQNYSRASRYLNLEQAPSGSQEGERLARVLRNLLDRRGNIMPYSWISDEISGHPDDELPLNMDRVGSVTAEGETIDLYVEETTGPEDEPIWLFSSETVEILATVAIEEELIIDRLLPDYLENNSWGGVPVGHWLVMILLAGLAYLFAWCILEILLFLTQKFWPRARTETTSGILNALALPIRLYLAVWLFIAMTREVGISIILRQMFSGITMVIGLLAFLILLWRLSGFIGEFSKDRMSLRGNVSGVSVVLFLQRTAKVAIVIFGIIAILGAVGVDITTGLAALGIGGIALALGAQKTIENFVGSVTVIADQPVRVGDFCKVGDVIGTVEKIGMRSTRIRTLNRTVVTIPNGKFSSDNIENYAHRDRFLFNPKFGLRYESTPDQIRYLLVELRAVLYAHPMVLPEPSRVRFTELGADSVNLEFFAYLSVTTFDDFLEVKEDLLLRMMDVVGESGTGFAFPSQTIYFGRDSGLSKDKARNVEEKVRQWREKGELQIPKFDPDRIKEIENKTPYPPEGSKFSKDTGTGKIPGL